MTVQTLQSRYYVSIPVDVNSKVVVLISNITLRVEAEFPVDVFVVDGDELAAFQAGRQFNAFYTARGVTQISQSVLARVRAGQLAYVVIQNPGYQPTAIYYVVS